MVGCADKWLYIWDRLGQLRTRVASLSPSVFSVTPAPHDSDLLAVCGASPQAEMISLKSYMSVLTLSCA